MTPTVGAIRRTLLCAALALAVPAVAACAAGGTASPGSGSSDAAKPAGSASASGAPSGDPSGVLVTYRRQGGLAGVDDSVVIHSDGSYQVSHRGGAPVSGTLPAGQLAAVQQAVSSAHLGDMPAVTTSKGVADAFVYHLGDGSHEVQVDQTSVPPAVAPLLTTLNGIAGA